MKKIFLVTFAWAFLMGFPPPSPVSPPAWAETGVVEAGNKVCPVSGDKISGKHFVVYKGKRYGLCCPHCEKDFKQDPEKYIATLSAEGNPDG